MSANYHTHTTFCDGSNTPEEFVRYALEQGFSAIGFSGHGYTPFDLRYCMKDTDGYIEEISRLKREFGNKITILCGIEEDAAAWTERERFDYIIGSSHYLTVGEKYYPIDSGYDYFMDCLTAFDGDVRRLAEAYYSTFVRYIRERKPDIVGHFDLITKFDEMDGDRLLGDPRYLETAEKYMRLAAENDVIFEVNTGAIARGIKKVPYPAPHLLYILKEKDCKLILSSDAHSVEALDHHFRETEALLRDIGFRFVYEPDAAGAFQKRRL